MVAEIPQENCFSVQTSTAETPRNKKQSFMPSRFKEFNFTSDDPGVVARPYINSLSLIHILLFH